MKKMILFTLILMAVIDMRAQMIDVSDFGFRLKTDVKTAMADAKGSPYLEEDFQPGSIKIEGKNPIDVFLRFNVVDEQIEIKTDKNSNEIYVIPTDEKIRYQIGERNIVSDKINSEGKVVNGYFIEYFDGDNIRLLSKPTARVTEAVKAKTGYGSDQPAEIKIEEAYYFVFEDGRAEKVRARHRDIKKLFDSQESQKYLSDNKIKSLEDLVAFASFYDRSE